MGLIVHGGYDDGLSGKNSCLAQLGHLGPRMSHLASQLWIRCNDCFTILHNERGEERHGNYINGFSEINLAHFGTKMVWHPLNFESARSIDFTQ